MPLVRRCLPFAAVSAASVWLAFSNSFMGDYARDAGPAVHALAHGAVASYLSAHALMGPFAIVLQAPFAALGGGSRLVEYQWACVPCLLAVGLLGLYLAGIARRRGASELTRFTIATLCLVNPLTFFALQTGHPEELLTGALAVAAVVVAASGHSWRAAILLGLALASKQWAVIAILPVLMALPAGRVRVALIAAAIALVLTLPSVLAAPGSFSAVQGKAASTGRLLELWSIWYPTAITEKEVTIGSKHLIAHVREAPSSVGRFSHPLIVLLVFVVPLALALRRRSLSLSATDAIALLALLALLRCALDPVGNLYYHEPLLLALIGWDALTVGPGRLPLRGLAATGVGALLWYWSDHLADPVAFNYTYIAISVGVCAAIGACLLRRPKQRGAAVAESRFDGVAVSGRSYGRVAEAAK